MERMFSKPFIAALEGHADAVEVLSRRPNTITDVASASWDGGEGFFFFLNPFNFHSRVIGIRQFQRLFFIMPGGGRTSLILRVRIEGRYLAFAGQMTTGF
jgi:hypothetical protein